ncbi:MAG: hypothetical protein NTW29_05770 [Bacteroidetes bacterium]|nr:hypothetical protein [Bacteroidota bacterium]
MPRIIHLLICVCFAACTTVPKLPAIHPSEKRMGGSELYAKAASMNWKSRDSVVVKEILAGNWPSFLGRLQPVSVTIRDSITGRELKATFYVMPDYLSVGFDRSGSDWARVCITPMAAQRIADSLHCFLPTRKMVDDIYKAATLKLEPMPLFANRDSTPVMWQHHLIIEGQRKLRGGLIAGIKKDVVISFRIITDKRPNRVAIYGWHKPDGTPIQPLYTGHVNWYVDYSHGIRLVYRKIRIGRKWVDYTDVLQHPVWRHFLCDEPVCNFFRYPY